MLQWQFFVEFVALLLLFAFLILLFFSLTGMYRIFRVNEDDKSMPLRDEKTGFCVPADFGEVSLFRDSFVILLSVAWNVKKKLYLR